MAFSFFANYQILAIFTGSIMEAIKIGKDDYMTVLMGIMLIVVGVYLVSNGGNK